MNTPIYDFVKSYRESGTIRLHMPGHKGVERLGCEALDITEIEGAGSLYEAGGPLCGSGGIIAESEKNASELFGFGHTLYSTGGSSQCIKAMLYLALLHGAERGNFSRAIFAARNAHRAFVHACALLDLIPEWIYPESSVGSPWSYAIDAGAVADMLARAAEKPLAVYLTSPDYLGHIPDIAAIAKVCSAHGVPLLVDNAHGAYLKFLPESRHPIDLGALMSCDSAHKTLPALTGGAYLQLSRALPESIASGAKGALALFGSTSPSYLTLGSLDLCNKYLARGYREALAEYIPRVAEVKEKLVSDGWGVADSDPLRIVVETASRGYSGREAAEQLRVHGVECEFADLYSVVLMATPDIPASALERVREALERLPQKRAVAVPKISIPRPSRALTVREALLSPRERIPVGSSVGRVCAESALSCPPAVAIVVGGEVISGECAALLDDYGIKYIEVTGGTPGGTF